MIKTIKAGLKHQIITEYMIELDSQNHHLFIALLEDGFKGLNKMTLDELKQAWSDIMTEDENV